MPEIRNAEHHHIGRRTGSTVLIAAQLRSRTRGKFLGSLAGTLGFTGSDDYDFPGTRPPQRQSRTQWTGAANHRDRAAHAGSHPQARRMENSLRGGMTLIFEYVVFRSAGVRPISRMSRWNSSALVYCPAVAPASREIFSSMSVPP